MSDWNQFEKCLICGEKFKIMIPLQQLLHPLIDGIELSVSQVLENLNFFTENLISDFIKFRRTVCCICIAKVQSCYEFKMQCHQIEKILVPHPPHAETYVEDAPLSTISPMTTKIEILEEQEELFEIPKESSYRRREMHENEDEIKVENKSTTTKIIVRTANSINTSENHLKIDSDKQKFVVRETIYLPCETNEERKREGKKSSQTVFNCPICQKSFKQKGHLNEHVRFHSGEKPFGCDVCGKAFYRPSDLMKHKMKHTSDPPEKTHVCDVCDKAFHSATYLTKHKSIHSNNKIYVCEVCFKTFIHHRSFLRHNLTHTSGKS